MTNSPFANNSEDKNFANFSSIVNKLKSLPDSSPLVVTDKHMNVLYSNNMFNNYFVIGKDNKINFNKAEPSLEEIFATFSNSEYSDFRFDLSIETSNKIKLVYSVDIERIFLKNSEYFVIIFKSLEEKSKLEQRVVDLHNALEFGGVPLMILNDRGRIRYSTKPFEEIFSITIELIYNNYLSNVLIDYLSGEDISLLNSAIINKEKFSRIIEIKNENTILYKELSVIPVAGDYDLPNSFIVNAIDITDYIIKNKIVQSSEIRLKSIINNISDLLIILKGNSKELFFENMNENFCKIFNISKDEAIFKSISSIFSNEICDSIKNIIFSESGNTVDIVFPNSSNEKNIYKLKYSFIDDSENDEKLYIVSFHDITSQKKYELQLQSAYRKEAFLNSLKTSFLENMSHEIRTPFNAIMGYSEIIEDCSVTGDYETIQELTVLVNDVLKRILNLFTNIVEVSQIESGEVQVEKESANISQILKNVYHKKVKEADSKNLKFECEFEPEVFNFVTDANLIDKALTPLIDNAIKYTDSGSVKLTGNIEANNYIICISDTGIGIDQKQIMRLLQPFTQEEEGYTRRYEGAGLGLNIAYKLIKLLNGNINISSGKEKGTFITIALPID